MRVTRKIRPKLPHPTAPRALAAAMHAPTASALRAVLLLAIASTGCDPLAPQDWPEDTRRAVHKAGVWIGVVEEPRVMAGAMEAVHPVPPPSPSAAPVSSALPLAPSGSTPPR